MEKFYVYILYSQALDKYYIGSANGIAGRLERHLQSKRGFTSRAKDWELQYCEVCDNRSDAVGREMRIKKWKSRVMIEKLISGY